MSEDYESTDRFDLKMFSQGATEWDHTDAVKAIDKYGVETGPISDRPSTGSYDDELYAATDQRILWKWDNDESDWVPFGGIGSSEKSVPGTAYFDSLRAKKINNQVSVLEYDGDLSDRLMAAISDSDHCGVITIPHRPDGDPWQWSKTLSIDEREICPLKLKFEYGTLVEYTGNSWTIDLVGSDSAQSQTFELDAHACEFDASNGNPKGFLRATDSANIRINANTRHYKNDGGDSTCLMLRNKRIWTEGFYISGRLRACNRGIDFETPEQTNGSGTASFADGNVENLAITFDDFGIRARGNHRVQYDKIRFFPKEDGATSLIFDGNLGNAVFLGPRFDDTTGVDDIAIQTTENYSKSNSPILINPRWSGSSKRIDRTRFGDDVWVWLADETDDRTYLENIGRGGINISRNGSFRIHDSAYEDVFKINTSGDIEDMRWFDTLPTFQSGIEFSEEDLTTRRPKTSREIAWHDGSNDISEGLCHWIPGGNWYSMRDGVEF